MNKCLMIVLSLCVLVSACQKQQTNADLSKAVNSDADFTLHDQDGNVFHLKDHRGKVVLLFFGYTSCPDICPVFLSKLARVYSLLGAKAEKVLTVFVTVDPERDTPQKLKEYLEYFKIKAIGLTGSKKEIDEVIRKYKASYNKVEVSSSAMKYLFDHTDYLYVIDGMGKTHHLFRPEDKPQDIFEVVQKIIQENSWPS